MGACAHVSNGLSPPASTVACWQFELTLRIKSVQCCPPRRAACPPPTPSLHLPPENRTFALTRGYTALGHDASLTYPDTAPGTALSLAFTPNALGQPTQAGSHAISATYHPNGQVKGFSYGNGLARSVTQNARGLPGRILDQYSGGKRLDHTGCIAHEVGCVMDGAFGHPRRRAARH